MFKCVDILALNPIYIPYSLHPGLREHHGKGGGKVVKARGWGRQTMFSGLAGIPALRNSRLLRLPVEEEATPHSSMDGGGFHRIPPLLEELVAVEGWLLGEGIHGSSTV